MLAEKLQEAAGNGIASTLYVDDVFSTWLYTGNGSTQTITNGIDLAANGGMVWLKDRSPTANYDHKLTDTDRGVGKPLSSNANYAQITENGLTAFNSTGFNIALANSNYNVNAIPFASWTFRKAAKFFDVVTWTGDGASIRTLSHNLGVEPGMIFIKRLDTSSNWIVWSTGFSTSGDTLWLNSNNAVSGTSGNGTNGYIIPGPNPVLNFKFANGTTSGSAVNASGGTYVAYLYAHDTSSTGIIQCGSFTTDGSGNVTVNLGWEPQYVLYKKNVAGQNWVVIDSMRGFTSNDLLNARSLYPNTVNAETSLGTIQPNATGFNNTNGLLGANAQFFYMAIRRPNKPPTSGTQVYYPVARSGTGATGSSTSFGQVTDLVFTKQRGSTQTWAWTDRLRGKTLELTSAATTVETAYANDLTGFDIMTGFYFGSGASGQMNTSGSNYDDHLFRRAPGFFDVVCWTGDGTNPRSLSHNLTVAPTLIITKKRNAVSNWITGYAFASTTYKYFYLNDIGAATSDTYTNTPVYGGNPTSSVFIVGNQGNINITGNTYVSYLFATLAGISKVGSYTGNGSTQTINCGFTGGARFVLIKRTDSTGDWYVFDTARGMTTLTDPYLLLNSTAAEVATLGAVTSVTTGFAVNAAIVAAINTNAASYIFLAIA